jgi:acetoin utilization protein AcuB
MQVNEIMTEVPVAIAVTTSIGRAWEMLRDLEVRHLPIVDADNALVGIVSDRDFGRPPSPPLTNDVLGAPGLRLDEPVGTIMTKDPVVVAPDAEVQDAAALMLLNRVGAVPVVSGAGKVVGIVSYLDVLRTVFSC